MSERMKLIRSVSDDIRNAIWDVESAEAQADDLLGEELQGSMQEVLADLESIKSSLDNLIQSHRGKGKNGQ